MPRFSVQLRPIHWLGLLWVYTSIAWLIRMVLVGLEGDLTTALVIGIRAGVQIGIGIGLGAGERWAWAMALCVGGLHGAGALALLGVGGTALATAPPHLAWQMIWWDLNHRQVERLLCFGVLTAAVAAIDLWILLGARDDAEVPYRRTYTVAMRDGFFPAAVLFGLDFLFLSSWKAGL